MRKKIALFLVLTIVIFFEATVQVEASVDQGCGAHGCASDERRTCTCPKGSDDKCTKQSDWSCSCDKDDSCGGGGGGGGCNPACTDGKTCDANNTCVNVCSPACKDNEMCNDEKKCVPNPACATFTKASVAPSTVRPFDQVTVKCNYGKRLDCLSVTGAGLANCRYSRYEGTDNIFVCDAGPNPGFYDDAKCIQSTGTAGKCCKGTDKAGDMTILGTDVHYDQDIVLPFDAVTFTAGVRTVISKNKGVRIELICNSDTCANGATKNAVIFALPFPVSTDFVTQTKLVDLKGTGDDRHYLIRISVDKGSEAYIDFVSMKDSKKRELIKNGDFLKVSSTTAATTQPLEWGEGDNKVGYYYGSLAANVPEPTAAPTTAPNPTAGPTGSPASVSLDLKIKLQGIAKKPKKADAINVQVKLAGGGLAQATAYKTVSFTVNDAGEWSGKADFDSIPTGGGYRVYIKGPKHIAKKICDSAPTETKGGAYHCGDGKITLKAGTNSLDFSKIIQLGGDLPEGGKQNGIIDAYDTTFVRTNLGSVDAAKTAIGDINLDGGIDTQDYSIILQSLSIKFDEE
jgi:hypothetical protein